MSKRNEIMNYAKEVAEKLKEYLAPEYAVTVMNVQKGRAVCTQLSVPMPGGTASINVTIDDFFKDGTSVDKAANIIAGIIRGQLKESEEITNVAKLLTDYEAVKIKLFIRLYNTEDPGDANEVYDTLKTVPKKKIADDLAAVCYVDIVDKEEGNYTTNVTKDLLKAWEKTFDEVFAQAQRNMAAIADFSSMNEIMVDFAAIYYENIGMDKDDARKAAIREVFANPTPMFVLTNTSKIFGAGMLAVPEVLEKCFQDKEWMILPSSVHEVIALSTKDLPIEEAKALVSEVNQNEVNPLDQLSDSVYLYRQGKLIRF